MNKVINIIILVIFASFISVNKAFAETEILVNIPSNTLELMEEGKTVKTFPVGLGRSSFPTPIGNFKVISKIKNPSWENPYRAVGKIRIKAGKSNPLGTRWIGFYSNGKGEYGIHGTNNPGSVGKLSSHGCIRMFIKDAERLFDKIDINTSVKITYYTHKVFINKGNIKVRKFKNPYNKKINTHKMIKEQLEKLNQNSSISSETLKKIATLKTGEILTIGKE